jgi:hypothetical protein
VVHVLALVLRVLGRRDVAELAKPAQLGTDRGVGARSDLGEELMSGPAALSVSTHAVEERDRTEQAQLQTR